MPIETNKPLKLCRFCNKEFANLSTHIINIHPSIIDQLEENSSSPSRGENINTTQTQNITHPLYKPPASDISTIVKEKLETMLNIKIIQMLEKGATIEEINRITNPPPLQSSGLDDIKKLVEIQRLITPQYLPPTIATESGGTDWGAIITGALPIFGQLLTMRNGGTQNGSNEHRSDEERSVGILKPIQAETTGDSTEPISIGEEPRIVGETTEPNDRNIETTD